MEWTLLLGFYALGLPITALLFWRRFLSEFRSTRLGIREVSTDDGVPLDKALRPHNRAVLIRAAWLCSLVWPILLILLPPVWTVQLLCGKGE